MDGSLKVLVLSAGLMLASSIACAQGLSKRPVRVLVPSAPGSVSETAIRLLLPKISEALGQIMVVDNRGSNNGVVGTEIAARATPDGYTITTGNSGTHAVNAGLYRKLPYDPVRDFVPISEVMTSGMMLVGNPRVPANSLPELIAFAKKYPEKLNMGVAGATGQLAGDALWKQLQIKLNNVPYKGSAPTEFALLSGEVDLSLLTPLTSLAHLNAGKLKAFGITSTQRCPLLPNVVPLAELGVPGYDYQFWTGVFAPAKTPDRVVRTINKAIVEGLQVAEVKDRINQLGFVTVGSSPEEFAEFVRNEVAKYRKVIAESGIQQL
jgi:tripartite-type tricarboxylate transporter receptor subunit TctC